MGFKEWGEGYREDDRKYFRVRRMVSFGKKSTVKKWIHRLRRGGILSHEAIKTLYERV